MVDIYLSNNHNELIFSNQFQLYLMLKICELANKNKITFDFMLYYENYNIIIIRYIQIFNINIYIIYIIYIYNIYINN